MKRYRLDALLCLLLGAGVVLLSMPPGKVYGAGSGGNGSQSRSETVRPDGTLEFLRPDGSLLASIVIEIAATAQAQMTGLMGRPSLSVKNGMLFIYNGEDIRYFWMKNTPVSLDIIFIDGQKRVVHIAESTTPMSEQFYSSRLPARFVVEVPAGFAKLFGVGSGTRIRWQTR